MHSNGNPPARSADELQKQKIVTTLQNFIHNAQAIKELGWDWNRILTPVVEGSSFDQIHRPASVSLSILLRHAGFEVIRKRRSIPQNAVFLVDESGRLYFSYQNLFGNNQNPGTAFVSPKDITADATALPGVSEDLKLLASMARLSGGWVSSGGQIVVGQWLRNQELQLPDSEEDARGLLDLLNFSTLAEPPAYGNYWQLLDAPDDSPFKLDEQRRTLIRQVSRNQTDGSRLLVEHTGDTLIIESVASDLPNSRSYRLQRLLETTLLHSKLGWSYYEALGWFPRNSESNPTTWFSDQMMTAALLLDLDPAADTANTQFAGFDLYSKSFFDRHPSWVIGKLADHLTERFSFSPLLAGQVSDVLAELVLSGMAPEYLFAHWPAELRIGTPAWVVGTQAIRFAESLIPGVTRNMSYEALLGFGQSVKAMPKLATLYASHSVDPVVTWALMNDLIHRNAEGNVEQEAVNRATEAYKKYLDQILKAANTLAIPLPHRKPLALKELKATAPGCDPDELLVKHRGSGGGGGRKVSVIDLYMGDELHTQDWDRVKGTSIYKAFPGLLELVPVEEMYEGAIYGHFTGITNALASNIEIALSQLHPTLASDIEYGALGIYCVQEYVYTPEKTSTARPGVIVPATVSAGETGRFGVIICAQMHYSLRCFELFPLRMECRYNPNLTEMFRSLVSGDFADLDTTFADRKKLEGVPIDVQAYLQNRAPRDNIKSRLFVRKIGEYKVSDGEIDPAYPARLFRSSRKEALGQLIAEENPYFTEKELHRMGLDQTERERAIEKTDAIFNTIINLIIPFKECVEGLSSGDPKRQQLAIVDCIVDAAVLALTVAAIPGKIAFASTKAATIASKLLSASRVVAGTTLSLFNPVDGLPQLLKGGGKLLGRGVGKLSGQAVSAAQQARQQLRYLTGANSYDLLKAIDHTGSASRIRMSLDTVAHGRALFKSDSITSAQDILARVSEKDFVIPKGVSQAELEHLSTKAAKELLLQNVHVVELKSIIGESAVDELLSTLLNTRPIRLDTRTNALGQADIFGFVAELETKKARYMKNYQQGILKRDLGQAPYSDVLPESVFNPNGLTDPAERAAAWMLNGSSSNNDFSNILAVLREYTGNKASLTDPAVITEIHRRLVPDAAGKIRDITNEAKYGSSITGFSLLDEHLKLLDATHPHFDKHLLAAVVGFQGFGDGNGRAASALYSISQLRAGGFTAMPPHVFRELNGIF